MSDTWTNLEEFLGALNAGIFEQKIAATLSEAGLGAVLHGDKKRSAKVSVEFSIARLSDTEGCDQVIVSHKLTKSIPTKRGKKIEEDTTETAMFVGRGGKITETQPSESHTGQLSLSKGSLV